MYERDERPIAPLSCPRRAGLRCTLPSLHAQAQGVRHASVSTHAQATHRRVGRTTRLGLPRLARACPSDPQLRPRSHRPAHRGRSCARPSEPAAAVRPLQLAQVVARQAPLTRSDAPCWIMHGTVHSGYASDEFMGERAGATLRPAWLYRRDMRLASRYGPSCALVVARRGGVVPLPCSLLPMRPGTIPALFGVSRSPVDRVQEPQIPFPWRYGPFWALTGHRVRTTRLRSMQSDA